MNKVYKITFLLLLVSSMGLAQKLSIGKIVPDYTFSETLNNDGKKIALHDLRGKIVILEFWATWCSPCISEMKKLDVLQKQYKDVLKVIAVSNENIDRLKKYINLTNSSLTIASDTTHRDVFPYKTIPHSILIDKNGIVRAITNPENINQQSIERLLKEDIVDMKIKDDFAVDTSIIASDTIKAISNSDYRIFVSGYNPKKRSSISIKKNIHGTENGVEINNSSLLRLYMSLFDITLNRIIFKDGLTIGDFPYENKNLYNFSVEVSDQYEQNWTDLSVDFLNSNLKYRIKKSVDSLICFEIKDIDKILKNSTTDNTAFSYGGGVFKAKKTELKYLVKYLEEFTDVPVIDQTNLEGYFDLDLNWQLEDPKTLHTELKKHGLLLEKSAVKVPVDVIHLNKN